MLYVLDTDLHRFVYKLTEVTKSEFNSDAYFFANFCINTHESWFLPEENLWKGHHLKNCVWQSQLLQSVFAKYFILFVAYENIKAKCQIQNSDLGSQDTGLCGT